MRVALVTTWESACGIAEHSFYLKQAIAQADPTIEIIPNTNLDPATLLMGAKPDLIWLNYHAALHSQWTPEWIRRWRATCPVGVTYHDTGVPNSDQAKGVCAAADAFVVHEPYDDLEGNGRYWRMGIPAWAGELQIERSPGSWTDGRPVLGSIGFPFPWKNYDHLARVTGENGWALLLIAPGAEAADVMRWERLNPHLRVHGSFLDRGRALATLAACDATAFCYTCANTGQSGAICQGIAARKPVIAFNTCRQFRALWLDPIGSNAIRWCETFDQVGWQLRNLPIERVHGQTVALAEQDSWRCLGQQYAGLLRDLTTMREAF